MTGRTHDLAAFTALNFVLATTAHPHMALSTALVAFTANMIGGLTPDIDQPTADLWHKIPGGGLYSRLVTPLLGGHRYISHSLLGFVLFGLLTKYVLGLANHVLLVDMTVVWWSFIIGYASHLVMDTFTREGVPWLFPVPFRFGFPPFAFLRLKTGGFIEKTLVFPGLILLNGYMIYLYYGHYLDFIHNYIR